MGSGDRACIELRVSREACHGTMIMISLAGEHADATDDGAMRHMED
eukprot:SAG22_NODE_1337_length_4697_cov_2.318182_5_plen_46_part_00